MPEKDNTDTINIHDVYFHHESFTQLRNSKEYHVFRTHNMYCLTIVMVVVGQ